MFRGKVISIFITPARRDEIASVDEVAAVEGKGLEGDRYFDWANRKPAVKSGKKDADKAGKKKAAKKTGKNPSRRNVSLIEAETIAALARDHDIEVAAADLRRNIVTEGVPLNHLVGLEFRVGEAVLRGVELCNPCAWIEKTTIKGVEDALAHRGGLRAEVIQDGRICVGDVVIR